MARIRTIKPEFWTSEQVTECSLSARLLFIGMWNFADDGGNMPASVKTLKMQIFPADNIDVVPLVAELLANGLIVEYAVDGRKYWNITGWKHQVINRPTPLKYPTKDQGEVSEPAVTTPAGLTESSVSPPVAITLGKEGKGKEGRGEDNARKRAHRLPPDWTLPPEYRQAAKERGLTETEIDRQAARMCNWSQSSPNGAKLDWYRTWLNWIDDAPRGGNVVQAGRRAAI